MVKNLTVNLKMQMSIKGGSKLFQKRKFRYNTVYKKKWGYS